MTVVAPCTNLTTDHHHQLQQVNLIRPRPVTSYKPATLPAAHGCSPLSATGRSVWLCGIIVSCRHSILLHINSRYRLVYSHILLVRYNSTTLSPTASMFFKSCNCNSSIATRVGFAVRRECISSTELCLCSSPNTDHILFELDVCMADEDTDSHQAD